MPFKRSALLVLPLVAVAVLVIVIVTRGGGGGSGGDLAVATATTPTTSISHDHDRYTLIPLGTVQLPDGEYEEDFAEGPGRDASVVQVSVDPPGTVPTAAQSEAAAAFLDQVRAGTAKYARIEQGRAAGYTEADGLDGLHLVNRGFVDDDRVLDAERPEFLMYSGDGDLIAVMFLAAGPTAHGLQVGGPSTVWHYHRIEPAICWSDQGLLPAGVDTDPATGQCPSGLLASDRSPEMLHVWLIDHPAGAFATDMTGVLGAGAGPH